MTPFSTPLPWDATAEGYAETTAAMLEEYTLEALDRISLSPQAIVLDVACGPGTLTLQAARRVSQVKALDFSESMLAQLNAQIQQSQLSNIEVLHGDGQNLPFPDNHFDAAFSMFGLMFFPDRIRGFAELYRCLKPGAQALVSSWAPLEKSPLMDLMFKAIHHAYPQESAPEEMVDSLENPEVFQREMASVGFQNVQIEAVAKSFTIRDVTRFWERLVQGSAPIVMMKRELDAQSWNEVEQRALEYLHSQIPNTPTTLSSTAWFGIGVK